MERLARPGFIRRGEGWTLPCLNGTAALRAQDRLWWYVSYATSASLPVRHLPRADRDAPRQRHGKNDARAIPASTRLFGSESHSSAYTWTRSFGPIRRLMNRIDDRHFRKLSCGGQWNRLHPELFIDARVAICSAVPSDKGGAPRFEDLFDLNVRAALATGIMTPRDQIRSLSFSAQPLWPAPRQAGCEIHRGSRWSLSELPGYVLHVLRSGPAADIYLFHTPLDPNREWLYPSFMNDSWHLNWRLTRIWDSFDRFRAFLPHTPPPAGSSNAVIRSIGNRSTGMARRHALAPTSPHGHRPTVKSILWTLLAAVGNRCRFQRDPKRGHVLNDTTV